ncbi:eukaryotic translation initiation factor 5 [Saitoella complicata NRRL Y-17804]|uniref:W2 domain-containing protein n=1 Tax=Saitoella complicata (strain BCRC 22490 / CBS 7301 / JCM 7358 / NBRC 10748 / NRRL Y-17804) TaxID=698492 RepID=A0A0E9NGE8_SAICN|nr:eukaryotic translation initiation factor 5 [Saitoella complicata NRRL Y-17804]ODQ53601.1 eukaryotic translation initiation factor 5 [Saitoella complicata NRRL Y-17804]GAO48781.1 hypothetical protein G7K_2950-t1 [Saitoella complicata NRRL Y-17804]
MSGNINIRRDVQDSFYRYKMPRIQSKIEGKGNGIKTVIPNLSDVARSLERPPMHVTKWFGFELGAQTSMNADTDRYIVNGAHDASKLQDSLDGFINRFVLCGACKNPETELVIQKDGKNITRDCKACGKQTKLDMKHKLSGVILKNPPEKKKSKSKSSEKVDKKDKKEKKSKKSKKESSEDDEEDGDLDAGSDDEFTKRLVAEAAALPPVGEVADTGDWSVDTSEAAMAKRVAELEAGIGKSTLIDNDEEEDEDDSDNPYAQLASWIEEQDESPSDVDLFKKIKELGIDTKHRTLQVLGVCLFDENILKELEARAPLLTKLIGDSEKHQKAFLGGIEQLIASHEKLMAGVPKILLEIYQNDLIEEEVLQAWGAKASKKYVEKDVSKKIRKAAQPFLAWLEEADDDSEEESDEEDDE